MPRRCHGGVVAVWWQSHCSLIAASLQPHRSLVERRVELFAARMIIGIRGDRVTGVGSSFTDEEMAGLIAYYRSSE